ncbi:MarR family winged helix-turn-helix transcriptional regulator [Priestia koreensis]|uniref:MarR family winged helix-turn-helix transcriptional regulator n=1 Tax=Priestia koreensis TaxID=284581 RepID=UPI001F55B745|nr:MarR family transcriptional regulator [Priestia koreensis]UNL86489.1 MarR family transcriptional regulator [Priestia koreensis]
MSHTCSKEMAILYHFYELNKQVTQKFERCTGMGQSRLDLLHHLYEVDEISQSSLQKDVKIDSAAITRHLKHLEGIEMISRRKNPDDNRVTFVRLTTKGRQQILSYRSERARFLENMLKDFSNDERSTLLSMLDRIIDNVSQIES